MTKSFTWNLENSNQKRSYFDLLFHTLLLEKSLHLIIVWQLFRLFEATTLTLLMFEKYTNNFIC